MNAEPPIPTNPQATRAPYLSPFHDLAYASLKTRIKAARVEKLIAGLAIAVGVLFLGNLIMLALVQRAQQDTVDLAAKVASGDVDDALLQKIGGKAAARAGDFGVLENLLSEIRAKEEQRNSLLTERPEFAGALPAATPPSWQAAAVQQLQGYERQLDAQIAALQDQPASTAARSVPDAAPAPLPPVQEAVPAPAAAKANPKPEAAKPAKPNKSAAKSSAKDSAKQAADSNYAKELTAALNRAARVQSPALATPAVAAETAPAPKVEVASAPASVAPVADAAPGDPGH